MEIPMRHCIDRGLLVHQIPTRPIPTVTDQDGIDGIELHPGEVMQRFPVLIASRAGNTGGIHVTGAPAIAVKRHPLAATPFQLMVHVAEHHQVSPSLLLHAIERKGRSRSPQSICGCFQSRPQGLFASDPSPVGPLWANTTSGQSDGACAAADTMRSADSCSVTGPNTA